MYVSTTQQGGGHLCVPNSRKNKHNCNIREVASSVKFVRFNKTGVIVFLIVDFNSAITTTVREHSIVQS